MSTPPELCDIKATAEALQALQEGNINKCGDLIIKWQNDLRVFESKKQDIEAILYLGNKLRVELIKDESNAVCIDTLNTLLNDIRETLNED